MEQNTSMVASHVETMNMILKGFTAAVVTYSNLLFPLLSLFHFENWEVTQPIQHYLLEVFSLSYLFPYAAVQNTCQNLHNNTYSVVFQILKNFF